MLQCNSDHPDGRSIQGEAFIMVKRGLATACAIQCAALVGTAQAQNNMSGPTLDAVRARGQLNCGVALP